MKRVTDTYADKMTQNKHHVYFFLAFFFESRFISCREGKVRKQNKKEC